MAAARCSHRLSIPQMLNEMARAAQSQQQLMLTLPPAVALKVCALEACGGSVFAPDARRERSNELLGARCAWRGSLFDPPSSRQPACEAVLHLRCYSHKRGHHCGQACSDATHAEMAQKKTRRKAAAEAAAAVRSALVLVRGAGNGLLLQDGGAGAAADGGAGIGAGGADDAGTDDAANPAEEAAEAEAAAAAERADARELLGLDEESSGDAADAPLRHRDVLLAYQRTVAVDGIADRAHRRATKAYHLLVRPLAADGEVEDELGARVGMEHVDAAEGDARRAKAAQVVAAAAQVRVIKANASAQRTGDHRLEAIVLGARAALVELRAARDDASQAAIDAAAAHKRLDVLLGDVVRTDVQEPLPVTPLVERRARALYATRRAEGAHAAVQKAFSNVEPMVNALEAQLAGPLDSERERITAALAEHFQNSDFGERPTVARVFAIAGLEDAGRREVCHDLAERACAYWTGSRTDGGAPLTLKQTPWKDHPSWRDEGTIEGGADKAVCRWVASETIDAFRPGGLHLGDGLARPQSAQPARSEIDTHILKDAALLGGASWGSVVPADNAVICEVQAFVEAYFYEVQLAPENGTAKDAAEHLFYDHASCYGPGSTRCPLCTRYVAFCGTLSELAQVAELTPLELFPISASAPRLYSCMPAALAGLKRGAQLCEASGGTLLKRRRTELKLARRPECCDVLAKIRRARSTGRQTCETCALPLPDETKPGCSEAIDQLQKQARGGLT